MNNMKYLKKDKGIKKFLNLLTVVILTAMLPITAFADKEEKSQNSGEPVGKVRVVIKDEQKIPEGESWEQPKGEILNTEVSVYETDSMIEAIARACEENDIALEFDPNKTYITSVDGLSEYDKGESSGWMASLNDWFMDDGLSAFTAADNGLCDGDTIMLEYTLAWGDDLTDAADNTAELKELGVSSGSLSPEYDRTVYEYNLAVKEKEISLNPKEFNRYARADIEADGTIYRSGKNIPVKDGTRIKVVSTYKPWEGEPVTREYTINVSAQGTSATVYVIVIAVIILALLAAAAILMKKRKSIGRQS